MLVGSWISTSSSQIISLGIKVSRPKVPIFFGIAIET
jgi:hypothetical protein